FLEGMIGMIKNQPETAGAHRKPTKFFGDLECGPSDYSTLAARQPQHCKLCASTANLQPVVRMMQNQSASNFQEDQDPVVSSLSFSLWPTPVSGASDSAEGEDIGDSWSSTTKSPTITVS